MKSEILPNKLSKFLWHFLRPKWGKLLIISIAIIFAAFTQAIIPYFLKVIVDEVVAFGSPPSNIFFSLAFPLTLITVTWIVFISSWRIIGWTQLKLIPPLRREIRAAMFNSVQHHSYRYFQDQLSGTLSNKILDMARGVEQLINCTTTAFIPITLSYIISTIILWRVHTYLGLAVTIWFIIYNAVTLFYARSCVSYSDRHSEANSQLSGKIVDTLRNMSVVRLFARIRFENLYLKFFQNREVDRATELAKFTWYLHLFQDIASVFISVFLLFLTLYGWTQNWITIGDFSLVTMTIGTLLMLCWWMSEQFVVFFKELGVCRQALSFISVAHEITDAEDAPPLKVTKGEVLFKDVWFHYLPHKKLFKNKNLRISPGEKIGLVGFSGSGKSTFVHLLMRYFDVISGTISIDGQDIRKVTQESLRESIAMIPQDTTLFHRTLMENIRYGNPQATDEEVIAASKKAHCHDFIVELEEGYDSLVGESGVKLSGGQRQRIAIARAVLKASPILILDEATSALDSVTERKIQKGLISLMENKTSIVIAHRLSTLSHLDHIFVFDDGVIVESGKHEELLKLDGHYSHLWNMQMEGFLPTKRSDSDPSTS